MIEQGVGMYKERLKQLQEEMTQGLGEVILYKETGNFEKAEIEQVTLKYKNGKILIIKGDNLRITTGVE